LNLEQPLSATDPETEESVHSIEYVNQNRSKRTGSTDDLRKAAAAKELSVKLTHPDDPRRAKRLNNLSIVFQALFDRTGELEDLNKAIEVAENASKHVSIETVDQSMFHNTLTS
jgi:hypothetical protein